MKLETARRAGRGRSFICVVLVPGLTSGRGAMYTECGDQLGAASELFWMLRSRTCGLCGQQLLYVGEAARRQVSHTF